MTRTLATAASLALVVALGACQKQPEAPAPAPTATTKAGNMTDMPMAGAMKHGMAVGTVTQVNPARGTITLDHGPMSGVNWPAMKMNFAATPEQLAGIKVGDKVDFEIDWDGKAGTVTKITKTR